MTMNIYVKLLPLTLLALSAHASDVESARLSAGIDLGYRQDYGQWTISGGEGGPNVISELEWDDLDVFELRLHGDVQVQRVFLEGSLAIGTITDGANRDSDYAFDDQQGEFSRSIASTEGDTVDFSLAAGIPFVLPDSGWVVIPLLGYSLNEQNHRDADGIQTIDNPQLEAALDDVPTTLGPGDGALGAFEGLDSTYDASWSGPFVGVMASVPVGSSGRYIGRYQLHIFDYDADLYWNLRDLAFENDADGQGHSLSMAYLHALTEALQLSIEGSMTSFESDDGIQTDPEGDITLNGAEWESLAFRIGLRGRW